MRASTFLQEVRKLGVRTIAGVPDSTLKPFVMQSVLTAAGNFSIT